MTLGSEFALLEFGRTPDTPVKRKVLAGRGAKSKLQGYRLTRAVWAFVRRCTESFSAISPAAALPETRNGEICPYYVTTLK
jgi:hypothetical protein